MGFSGRRHVFAAIEHEAKSYLQSMELDLSPSASRWVIADEMPAATTFPTSG